MHPNKSKRELFIRGPKLLIDLYEWLPPYGETKIALRSEGLVFDIEILYDSESKQELEKLIIRFTGVCGFSMFSSPGVELTCLNYEAKKYLGSVVEYTNSEAAKMWMEHFGSTNRTIRHFELFFLAENKHIEVFADDCFVL